MKVLSIEFTTANIYLYEQNIEKNTVQVLSKHVLEMPANAYINRVILNNDRSISDTIKNYISSNNIRCKKVVLIAPNTDNMVEEFSMLDAKKKEMDSLIEQELRKRHKLSTDYMYDYIILGPDPVKEGFVKIQVTLCVKNMIQNMYDVIKKSGLIPYKVIFVNRAMEKLAHIMHLSNARNNSILGCIHSDEAHFMYVGHGEDPYYRYSRIKNENKVDENLFILSSINSTNDQVDTDEELQRKVMDDIARLERFHRQRHPDGPQENVYLYGSYDKIPELCDFLKSSIGANAEILPFEERATQVKYNFLEREYIYNHIAAAETINLPEEMQFDFFGKLEDSQGTKESRFMYLPLFVSLLLVIIILAMTLVTRNQYNSIKKECDAIENYINDERVLAEYDEKLLKIEECANYVAYNTSVSHSIELLETMPRFQSETLKKIDGYCPSNVVITGYSFNEGQVSLSCYSGDQYTPAEFARILEQSGTYTSVTYKGFEKNVDRNGDEIYSFSVVLMLW